MKKLLPIIFALTIFSAACYKPATADREKPGSLRIPQELQKSELLDRAGANIPLDISLIDQDNQKIKLQKYFSNWDKPVVLTMGYYGCPMLCTLVLNGLVDSLKKVNAEIGKDYQVVSISIDPREKSDLAKKKQDIYAKAFNLRDDQKKFWNFHVTSEEESKRLADALGFGYYFDKKADQYAHGAGFFVLSPKGVLSRTLYGINFKPKDVKLSFMEASEGRFGSFIDRVILSCFHYDPDSHRYGIYIFGVMRIGGLLTILIIGIMLAFHFRGERRKKRKTLN